MRGSSTKCVNHVSCVCRSTKPRCRPSFRQIQIHLEIASQEWLSIPESDFAERQVSDHVTCSLIRRTVFWITDIKGIDVRSLLVLKKG